MKSLFVFVSFLFGANAFAAVTCQISMAQKGSAFEEFLGGTISLDFESGKVVLRSSKNDRTLNADSKISSFKIEGKFCGFKTEKEVDGNRSSMFSCTEGQEFGRDHLTTVWMTYDPATKNGGYQEVYFNGRDTFDPYMLFESCF